MSPAPHVLIVVTSTRPSRNADAVAEWVIGELSARDDLTVTVADLRDLGLPLLDEPGHPSDGVYLHDHTKRWSALVDAAAGFVFVVPEYNRGAPGSLKNALDFLYHEWQHKPVGFVSYSGGASGGIRAVEMAKMTMTTLSMLPIPAMVNLPRIADLVDEGTLHPPPGAAAAIGSMATRLVHVVGASACLRAA